MKKNQILISFVLISLFIVNARSQTGTKGEEAFSRHADACLLAMEKAALEISAKGVALMAYIPGDTAKTWISKMLVAGSLRNNSANFLAIAYSKAAEMADTYLDSGSGKREILHGEFGYMGGLIRKVDSGYILAVFSGASGEEDAAIAQAGLDCLLAHF